MAKALVDDELWAFIAPLLPKHKRRRRHHPGRKPMDDRRALTGIVFVLKTGIPWEYLPQEMGCGSGMSCWRKLRDWQRAGVWRKLHHVLLNQLNAADQIDGSRGGGLVVGTGAKGGEATGPNPTDRGKLRSKHHVLTDGQGTPVAFTLRGAQRHDVTQLLPLLDTVPPVAGKPGHPRRRFARVQGDRGYDSDPHRRQIRRRGSEPVLARRGMPHGSHLGVYRWVVERALSWLHQNRRLKFRYERDPVIHEAFLALACALICYNCLQRPFC